ncbi:MAG: hypothetical protein QGG05_00130 [Candidatus Latescibacteria bacterium]|nr:hypothetical protein [Candidatus Latescibacterota bacterium]
MAGDEAEDLGQILSLDETIVTSFGTFTQCLKTLDTDALEPGLEEHKWYAPGEGAVAELEFKGGEDELVLVELTMP